MICKSENEKELLRESGKRLSAIRRELAEATVSGISTAELNRLAYVLCTENSDKPAFFHYSPLGAPRPFPASICVSINDVVVHGIPTENPRIVRSGDLVSIDVGLIHKGFVTDSAVTVAVGEVSEEEKDLIETAERALTEAIKVAKVGMRVGDISKSIERTVRRKGFGIPEELGGHGVGRKVHEEPSIPNAYPGFAGQVLREGEVVAIEPIITLGSGEIIFDAKDGYTVRTKDGSKSAHAEHTVLITKEGAEILTL